MKILIVLGSQIAIMFLYMGIGYALYRTALITREGSKSLAHLLLYVVLPCVVIRSFSIERTAENTQELLISLALGAGLLLLSVCVCAVLFGKAPVDQFGAAFSNAGFMGFPLIAAVMGKESVFYAAGFVALLNALQWTYGQWVLTGDKKNVSARAVAANPIVISLIAGLAVFFSGISIPNLLSDLMETLAGLNAPVAMIILGVYLAQTDLQGMLGRLRLYYVSAIRLLVIPLLSVVLMTAFLGHTGKIGLSLLLAASAPVGSNVAVYAQKLGLDYTYAVQIVCISTLLSVVSMPLVLGAAQMMGLGSG